MDLTMKSGGDDSCFLFNLTQNLRFDTMRTVDISGREMPVYTSALLLKGGNDSEDENQS